MNQELVANSLAMTLTGVRFGLYHQFQVKKLSCSEENN